MSVRLIYVTTADRAEAERIGEALVGERLAACANILGPITSLYWWEGRMQRGDEVALIAKTTADLVDRIVARVRELHSYTVPCIVALPIEQGNPAFLRWILEETAADRRTAVV